jgi:molecular chaperone GrpE
MMAKASPEPLTPGREGGPPPDGSPSGTNGNGHAPDRLAEVESELADTKDRLLRALADQENSRRIAERNREEAIKFAVADFAGDLIETLDNLERALKSATAADPEKLLTGVASTERALLGTLNKHGIRKLEPRGEPFDPTLHHAVYQKPDPTVPEGTVVQVVQPGYMIRDRLLRPAMVGVATNDTAAAPPSD